MEHGDLKAPAGSSLLPNCVFKKFFLLPQGGASTTEAVKMLQMQIKY